MIKVAHWGAGNTGIFGLHSILSSEHLELTALMVGTPEKVGKDAGALTDRATTGVCATNNLNEFLAQPADCVTYFARDSEQLDPSVEGSMAAGHTESICRILASGRNVITTTVTPFTYPDTLSEAVRLKLDNACREGQSAFLGIGIDPGFMNDMLPLILSGFTSRLDKITAQEILNYGSYNQPDTLKSMGYGLFPKDIPDEQRTFDGVKATWSVAIRAMASELGLQLEDIDFSHEFAAAEFDFDIPAFHVPEGAVAASRFTLRGIINGHERLIVEHVTRLHEDVAPHWAKLKSGSGGFRIIMDGDPPFVTEVALGQTDDGEVGDATLHACHATAARAINAVPIICQAPPGVYSQFTLPKIQASLLDWLN